MSKDVDSVSCTSEVAGLPIVNHLYGGAQIPVPHVGHSEVNGVGVKITLFNGSSLVDEVDIRGLYNWTTDPLIKGLSNNPFIYDPIEKALPAIK